MADERSETARIIVPPAADEALELHAFENWIIARAQPRCEAKAQAVLTRVGIESYYPKGLLRRFVPQRRLPAKTRHARRYEIEETERAAYPGYILVRHMFGDFDLNRLFDLPHMGGVCMVGRAPATLSDLAVETLRLEEADGRFNVYASDAVERVHFFGRAAGGETKTWTGETKLIGRTCQAGRIVSFYQALGRITRVIASADEWRATR